MVEALSKTALRYSLLSRLSEKVKVTDIYIFGLIKIEHPCDLITIIIGIVFYPNVHQQISFRFTN